MNAEIIYKVLLSGFLFSGMGLGVVTIGQPRKPLGSGSVLFTVLLTILIVYGLWAWA